MRRRAFTRKGFCSFAHCHLLWFLPQTMNFPPYLIVGGNFHGGPSFRREALSLCFELSVLMNGGHRELRWEQIQTTDAFLKSRVDGGSLGIAAMRHTGELTLLTGSPHQSSQSRTWDT